VNNTNRVLNRLFLFLVGLLGLVIGGGLIAVAVVPAITAVYTDTAPTVSDAVTGALQASPVFGSAVSWISAGVVAVLLLLIVLLLAFALRQGRGHTGTLVTEGTADGDTTIVEAKVAEQAIEDALATHPQLIASSVSAYRVNSEPVLKVSVTARRGVSPVEAAALVEETLHAFDSLLGTSIPALVLVGGGMRARVTNTTVVN
jgi:hypothetical protein